MNDNLQKPQIDWRSKPIWSKICALFTVAWIFFVIWMVDGDMNHSFANTMYLVPLAAWIALAVIFKKKRQD